jgi:hypothetical protein
MTEDEMTILIDALALNLISIDWDDFYTLCHADCPPVYIDCDCLRSSLYSVSRRSH